MRSVDSWPFFSGATRFDEFVSVDGLTRVEKRTAALLVTPERLSGFERPRRRLRDLIRSSVANDDMSQFVLLMIDLCTRLLILAALSRIKGDEASSLSPY